MAVGRADLQDAQRRGRRMPDEQGARQRLLRQALARGQARRCDNRQKDAGHLLVPRRGTRLVAEVPRYAENVTPQEELDKLNIPKLSIFVQRDRGSGRPTKRERREIDSLMGELYSEDEDEQF